MTGPPPLPEIDPSFVGRGRELARFRAALTAAMEGRRQLLLLCGEPGIGKTRCAEVFARTAEDCGVLTLWGRCYEEPGAPPYWPWVQILREYVRSSSESELQQMAGARVHDMAAILPDLAAHADDRVPPEPANSDHVRFRTFDAIAQFLGNAARRVPLVLIIDNLHWADAPSLSLLEFLSRELARSRVLIICTFRDVEVSRRSSLAGSLGELSRETGVDRMRLTGLPESSIGELAERALGIKLQGPAVDAIYSQTDGNPLFVIEVLKVLQEESANVDADVIPVHIPDSVRETIGRRLKHLTPSCVELLTIASVLGRNFTIREITTVAERDFEMVLENFEAAARSGIIEPNSAHTGGYRFTHALIREVLYDELPLLDRLKLHGRVADTLAEIHKDDLVSVLNTIAHHYSEATPLGYAEQAVKFELRAAEHAIQMCAYEDAVTHYDRALAALSANGYENDARKVKAFYLKGNAFNLLGDTKLATEAFLQGVKHAIRLRSPLLVDIITRLLWSTSDGPQNYLVPLLEKTLLTLPRGDSVVRAKALVSLAFALRSASDAQRIESLVTEAVAMADRLGDAEALCTCVKLSIMALRAHPHTLRKRLALGSEYIAAARRSGDDEGLADAYSWQLLHLLEDAKPADLERVLEDYRRMSLGRFGIHQYYIRCAEVTLALLHGEWQTVEQDIEALLATGSKTRRADAEGVYSAQMFALNRDLGRLRQLAPSVERFVRNGTTNAWIPGLMLTCIELGMIDDARRFFERLAQEGFAAIPRDDMFVTCLVYCTETCARLGDAERAKVLYSLLLPYAGGTANHPRAVCFGATDLYLAMLAATSGDRKRAATHFSSAYETNQAIGAWPWLARTLFAYGKFLCSLDDEVEQARGRSLLSDAEQLAARLGMTRLVEEIGSGPRGETGVFPDGLTAREVEVLQLLAIGRSNKDISMVLSISLNTVATHVRSILNKTSSANRTEAAAYAIQQGLRDSAQAKKHSSNGGPHAPVHDRAQLCASAEPDGE
jgi:DNA-binding CsgD family transcriptional regulator